MTRVGAVAGTAWAIAAVLSVLLNLYALLWVVVIWFALALIVATGTDWGRLLTRAQLEQAIEKVTGDAGTGEEDR